MKSTLSIQPKPEQPCTQYNQQGTMSVPFAQETVVLTKQEHIKLVHQINYWQALHTQAKEKIIQLELENLRQKGKIKDLQNRLFGKHSEKGSTQRSKQIKPDGTSKRSRGQQPNSTGHGRTRRPDLHIVNKTIDLVEHDKYCAQCDSQTAMAGPGFTYDWTQISMDQVWKNEGTNTSATRMILMST